MSSNDELQYLSDDHSQWTSASRTTALEDALNGPFAGTVVVDMSDRTTTAGAEYKTLDLTNKLVFWTDCSMRNRRVGIAVAWKANHYDDNWTTQTYALEGIDDVHEGEFFAIAEAIKIAMRLHRRSQVTEEATGEDLSISCVTIYSDSTAALGIIRDFHTTPRTKERFTRHIELAKLKERAKILVGAGVPLKLHWVKGHRQVAGNVLADRLARQASTQGADVDILIPSAIGYLDPKFAATAYAAKRVRKVDKKSTLDGAGEAVKAPRKVLSASRAAAKARKPATDNIKVQSKSEKKKLRLERQAARNRALVAQRAASKTCKRSEKDLVVIEDDTDEDNYEDVENDSNTYTGPVLRSSGLKMDRFRDLLKLD